MVKMAAAELPKYEYKGHTYKPWKEIEYDSHGEAENTKIFHIIDHPDGIQKEMDWSSYSVPTFEEFKLWIELSYPDRYDDAFGKITRWSPIDEKDLLTIQRYRFSTADGRGL